VALGSLQEGFFISLLHLFHAQSSAACFALDRPCVLLLYSEPPPLEAEAHPGNVRFPEVDEEEGVVVVVALDPLLLVEDEEEAEEAAAEAFPRAGALALALGAAVGFLAAGARPFFLGGASSSSESKPTCFFFFEWRLSETTNKKIEQHMLSSLTSSSSSSSI
jgi:hypothetical protein